MRRFDLVIGSGRRGQRYLYWRDRLLSQLPVSFFALTDPLTLPAPVLSSGSVTYNSVLLNWTDRSLEDSFTLQKRVAGSATWQDVATVASNVTHFTVTGRRLCWKLTVRGIDEPVAAHLHSGGFVANGPVLVALGRRYTSEGCTTMALGAAAVLAGCAACGGVYVDVHTKKFRKGAIRGTLEVARRPLTSEGGLQ